MVDPRFKTLRERGAEQLAQAASALAARQVLKGPARGNVPPWRGADDADFHGTLAAIWIWARALAQDESLGSNRDAAWTFVEANWARFVPDSIGANTSYEAPYDCAMVLRAALADRAATTDARRGALVQAAARVLSVHLADLDDMGGREFHDPGFLAWNLAEYARAVDDRGLLAMAQKFVERAFGMKAPASFAKEPVADDGLFDFSSTSATRVMAILASEGTTPFIGAWLRERVGPSAPRGLVARPRDESTWNACVAQAMGRAYVVSTDPAFLDVYEGILSEIANRDRDGDGAIGRDANFPESETLPTFYYALASDVLT